MQSNASHYNIAKVEMLAFYFFEKYAQAPFSVTTRASYNRLLNVEILFLIISCILLVCLD